MKPLAIMMLIQMEESVFLLKRRDLTNQSKWVRNSPGCLRRDIGQTAILQQIELAPGFNSHDPMNDMGDRNWSGLGPKCLPS